MDTYIGICKICGQETDCIDGVCQECFEPDEKQREIQYANQDLLSSQIDL